MSPGQLPIYQAKKKLSPRIDKSQTGGRRLPIFLPLMIGLIPTNNQKTIFCHSEREESLFLSREILHSAALRSE